MTLLDTLLERSAALHDHVCPRQVLGVRIGLYAARLLGVEVPQNDKRLYVFVETDGCFADGVATATGCTLGHRTLRLMDEGKVAAVVIDTMTECAVRLYPHPQSRERALVCMPQASSRWHAQLEAYQVMSDEDLFIARDVVLTISLNDLISKPDARSACSVCGEEIINQREVHLNGLVLCRSCAGAGYWKSSNAAPQVLRLETLTPYCE